MAVKPKSALKPKIHQPLSSVILVCSAKAVGPNEILFVRGTPVVPSNIVLVRRLGLFHRQGRFGGWCKRRPVV